MKKIKFLLFLLLASSMTFVACSKDEEEEEETPAKVDMKIVKSINEDGSYAVYLYNDDNNLKQILYKDKDGNDLPYYDDYQYTGKDLTTYTFYKEGAPNIKLDITYVDGKPTNGNYQLDQGSGLADYLKFVYTFAGDNLTRFEYTMDLGSGQEVLYQVNYTYSGSNISKAEFMKYDPDGLKSDGYTDYTYDDKKNPQHGVGSDFIFGDVGSISTNNIATSRKVSAADVAVDAESFDNTYEYNTNDYPVKVTSKTKDGQSTKITIAEYENK